MMYHYYTIIILIAGLQVFDQAYAQSDRADSLVRGLKEAISLEEQADYLNELSFFYQPNYPDTSFYYAQQAFVASKKASYQEGLAKAYLNLAASYSHYTRYNFDSLNHYFIQSLNIYQANQDSIRMAEAYYFISKSCYQSNNYTLALQYGQNASEILEKLDDKPMLARSLSLLCKLHNHVGDNALAVNRCIKSLRLYDELQIEPDKAALYNTLGSANYDMKIYDRAKEYLLMAMEIAQKHGLFMELSDAYINMGEVLQQSQDFEGALEYFRRSLALDQNNNDEIGMSWAYFNIGKTFIMQGENEQALNLLEEALEISKQYNNLPLQAKAFLELGRAYYNLNDLEQSFTFLNQSLNSAKKLGTSPILMDCYLSMAKYYDRVGDLENALVHFKLYDIEKERLYEKEKAQKVAEIETLYELDKKDNQISLLQQENQIQILLASERKLVNYGLIVGMVLLGGLGTVFFSKYRLKIRANKKLEKQKEAINQQKLKIEKQRDEIITKSKLLEESSRDIKDSIMYAKRIQLSLLPEKSQLKNIFPDSFVFFKPKDIVSGDFYWLHEMDEKVIVATLDCTGHGVPGAFMTVLANSILNQLVLENKVSTPNVMLSQMDNRIRQALHQHHPESTNTDGLDMAVCIIDRSTMEVCYSGAQMNVYYTLHDELIQFQADRYSIGGAQITDKYFTNKCVRLQRGSMLYLASDGFQDQFGGLQDKKFMRNRFRDLLNCLQHRSTADQYQILRETFENWRGKQVQTDDVMVLGIRL